MNGSRLTFKKGIKGQKEIKFLPCLRGGAAGGGVLPALLVVPSFRNPHGHELRPCCVRPIAAGPNELHFVPFVPRSCSRLLQNTQASLVFHSLIRNIVGE